jgi:hypothetical protein
MLWSMRIVKKTARWVFIGFSVIAFLLLFYLALIGLRPGQGQEPPHGLVQWVVGVSQCGLISGLLPLIVAIIWASRIQTLKYFWQGSFVLVGMLVLHYVLVVVNAHSDQGYLFIQTVEFVLTGVSLWFLLKPQQSYFKA